MATRIGIDIGGTFTDLVFLAPDGKVERAKVLSTPDDYSQGIATGLESTLASGALKIDDIAQIMHGTTVATNAILEGKGARVALITTRGFRDVLEIRRLRMPVLYDIRFRKPKTLVPRNLRFEIEERINSEGEVDRPFDSAGVKQVVEKVLAQKVDAVAVCLINSYANGAHERLVRDLIRAKDQDIPVTLSSELLPEIKEYERTSTTVVNTYILPVVKHYLGRLAERLDERKIHKPLTIMQSSGGAMSAGAAAERPIHIIESGPAAGVVGAAELARRLDNMSLLSFDMGGTTAKAALVDKGQYLRVGSLEVGGGINIAGRLLSGGGYHVRAPAIDIAEVGAGGGSLVQLDGGGGLKVGPESAGAAPGPACYARGGTKPTVTDANVILGFINPVALAGGGLPLRRDLAVKALDEAVAKPMGLSIEEAAWGVHRVANATMARALRAVSTERGRDPREFAIMAFGGNGPVHAATLAKLPAALDKVFRTMEEEGGSALADEGFGPEHRRYERQIDLRYVGANSELTVDFPTEGDAAAILRQGFGAAHERQYGYRSDEEAVETMNLRVVARGIAAMAHVPNRLTLGDAPHAGRGARQVYFGPEIGSVKTPICARADLDGTWRQGPLLVEEFDSTSVIPPGARARRIAWDTIEIELG
jgi:N-methylhydantoinase A